MTTFAYIDVPEQGEWVDNTLATASWWDKYVIHPGTYPLEFTGIDYRPVNPDHADPTARSAYYARARVSATLIESYRENRLLSEVRADMRHTRKDTEVTVVIYAYEAKPGTTRTVLGRLGRVLVWDADTCRVS